MTKSTFTEEMKQNGYDYDEVTGIQQLPTRVGLNGRKEVDHNKIAKMWNDWRTI